MKSAEEIVAWVRQFEAWIIERPQMYGHDAEAVESTLIYLDTIVNYATIDSAETGADARSGWYKYLHATYPDLGSTTRLGRLQVDEDLDVTSDAAFAMLSEDWRKYIQWRQGA